VLTLLGIAADGLATGEPAGTVVVRPIDLVFAAAGPD
jgi:hypothetical protein